MRTLILMMLATLPLLAHAGGELPTQDRVVFEDGQRVVLRSSLWPDFEGGWIRTEQKLTVNPEGSWVYRYDTQLPETQKYHQLYCSQFGAQFQPMTKGESHLSDGSAGWACVDEMEFPSGDENAPHNPRSSASPAAIDYVYATAPSGTAQVGVNFFSYGSARYESSQSGSRSATVHVDNGRCRNFVSDYFSSPFIGDIRLGVSCIVQQPRLVSTGMDVCIPKLCGPASGTISVLQRD